MVAGHDHELARVAELRARDANGVPRAQWTLLHRDGEICEVARGIRPDDDDERFRRERPHRGNHPVDEPSAEQRMQVLGRGGLHPRAEPCGHHDGCEVAHQNWGARIRTWDRGTKTRCLTTWLRPIT